MSAAAAYGVRIWLVHEGVPDSVRLVTVGAIVFAGYALLLLVAAPSLVSEVRGVLRRREGQLASAPDTAVTMEP
jgi:hypothetical protein